MNFLSVRQKIGLLVLGALVGILAMGFTAMRMLHGAVEAENRHQLKVAVDTAIHLIRHQIERVKRGEITQEVAQREVIDQLRGAKISIGEQGEDFYIDDYRNFAVMAPSNPQLEGKANPNTGDPVIDTAHRLAQQQGEHWFIYTWPDPQKGLVTYLAYLVSIPEWEWLVGLDMNIDSVANIGRYIVHHGSTLGITLLVIMVALIVLSQIITSEIMRSLTMVSGIIERMRHGEYQQAIIANGKGEFAQLLSYLAEMQKQIASTIDHIREGASTVAQEVTTIAASNQQLSQRLENQASNIAETAASMEQMTSTVKQNADNAQQADQLSESAQTLAQHSSHVVTEAVNAMNAINEASRKIADIIGVIDEIAFQTNLLALNAAVEAARAGEQGRGFAVVAAEVRNLAQRSSSAAKEIKELIQDSVAKVDGGTKLVDAAGKNLRGLFESVNQVSSFVAEIASASREQSAGIEQVNLAITQMEEVIQRNAAMVEETAATSQALDEQAKALIEQVKFFKTGHEMPASAR